MKLLTQKELSVELGITTVTMSKIADKLPRYKVGKRYRYDLDEVKQYMKENKQ